MKSGSYSSLFTSKEARITADFEKKIHLTTLLNTEVWILISLPNGLRGGKDITCDENYLEAVLKMLEKYNRNLQEKYQQTLGKINILVAGGITRHDFFLKFPEHIDVKLREIYDKLPRKNPTEIQLAEDLAEALRDDALLIEQLYIKKYQKYLDTKFGDTALNYEIIGWEELLINLGEKYHSVKNEIIDKYHSDIAFQNHFNTAATDFFQKKQASIDKLQNKFKELCPEIKINFNLYAFQACLLYLLAEAAFFRLVSGKLLYPSPIMEELFNIILKENPKAEFLQTVYEPWMEKPLTGYSSSFVIRKEIKSTMPATKDRKKAPPVKSNSSTSSLIQEPLSPTSAEVSSAIEKWWRTSTSRDKRVLFELVKISTIKAQTSQLEPITNSSLCF